ncbi:hypothetical protein RCL1_004599 [Eukaryota sp. TZLM3-RCL]
MAKDLSFAKHGASIFWVSSENPDHPSSNIVDADNRTFFYSTGLFPQEVIIAFPHRAKISKLRTITQYVKSYDVYYCNDDEPTGNWNHLLQVLIPPKDKSHVENSSVAFEAAFLKIVITSGYNHFVKIYRVICEGK